MLIARIWHWFNTGEWPKPEREPLALPDECLPVRQWRPGDPVQRKILPPSGGSGTRPPTQRRSVSVDEPTPRPQRVDEPCPILSNPLHPLNPLSPISVYGHDAAPSYSSPPPPPSYDPPADSGSSYSSGGDSGGDAGSGGGW